MEAAHSIVVEVPGRGLGTVAARDLRAGEVVLVEPPLLVYSPQVTDEFCSYCLKALPAGPEPSHTTMCIMCSQARFCDQGCMAAATADPGSHCPLVCKTLSCCNVSGLTDEDQKGSIHFLIRAASLFLQANGNGIGNNEERARCLMSLASQANRDAHDSGILVCKELHGRVERALQTAGVPPDKVKDVFPLKVAMQLLGLEAINAYGIPAPVTGTYDDRRVRGTAIYYQSSRINHECLPNVARCDDFDRDMCMRFVMLHDLPAGEELTQSYFPLGLSFVERQSRLREQYGFICTCPRCVEEACWEGATEGADVTEHMNLRLAVKAAAPQSGNSEDLEPYIHVFLTKYVCPNPNDCGGTMVPENSSGEDVKCSLCGWRQSHAQFLAALEN